MRSTIVVAVSLLPILSSTAALPQSSKLEKLDKRSFSQGPLLPDNFPDPSFLKVGNTYYATSTNSNGKHVPMARSDDFVSWTRLENDALPNVGKWSTGNNVWAPDIMQLPNGKFVMYYTGQSTDPSGKQCIGAATSDSVEGPYIPLDNSLACPVSAGGAIDPAGFTDADGTLYVTYKIDGNSLGGGGPCGNADGSHSTPIQLQIMECDGVTPRSGTGPETILDRDSRDGPLVEAPSLSRIADPSSAGGWLYLLFFSSNCFNTELYDTSYAVSTSSVHGPYEKAARPLVVTGSNGLNGPGHMDTAVDIGADGKVLFHANRDGEFSDNRLVWGGSVSVDVGARTVSI